MSDRRRHHPDKNASADPIRTAYSAVDRGDLDGAERIAGESLRTRKQPAEAYHILALVEERKGRIEQAVALLHKAIETGPDHERYHFNLANILQAKNSLAEAVDQYKESLRLKPDYCRAHNNLAAIYISMGELGKAQEHCLAALEAEPSYAGAHCNLANIRKNQGLYREAIESYRAALSLRAGYAEAHSNLLLCMNYDPSLTREEVFAEHRAWGARYAAASGRPPRRPRESGAPVNIGYVSGDFRSHSVAHFINGILAGHDRARFRVHCYSNTLNTDRVTGALREKAEVWRDIAATDDRAAAEMISRDGIDILVDLSGHTARNRLPLFALRPAPVQATFLGYPNTTGMDAIDYRLTDDIADPADSDRFHTETLVRLPHGFLQYTPAAAAPDPAQPPCLRNGFVTFGSFNNLPKTTPETIRVWSEILGRLPGSRIVLKNKYFTDPSTRQRFAALFADYGVTADRVDLKGPDQTTAEHLEQYNGIDIALDTFPYNGTTTTIEALWMGVPVVALTGSTHAGRVGASILTRIGLPTLATATEEKYAALAVYLGSQPDQIARLHRSLRSAVSGSPLCDKETVVRDIENAYLDMLTVKARR